MEIKFSKAAIKALSGMSREEKQRIKTGIIGLPGGDVKPLKGNTRLYRLRVGNRRIVFSYPDKGTIYIEKIAPRGDIYKGGLL